ncbi:hypothetical protein COO60DRAFT_1624299 [Scenedesmus sp. NREL 46B-D3]|nr:hypothetical protein COO60DRAFT_1624299 [Scenedesmus sp. NREL 46B-D3]
MGLQEARANFHAAHKPQLSRRGRAREWERARNRDASRSRSRSRSSSRGGRAGYNRGSGGRSSRRSRSRSRSRGASERDGRGGGGLGGSGSSRHASGSRRPDSERRDRDRDRDRDREWEYRDSDRRDYDSRDRGSRQDRERERYSERSERGDRDRERERERDRQERYTAPPRGGSSSRDAVSAPAPKPPSRAALLAAVAAAPPPPPRPDNSLGVPPATRAVSGRCINVAGAALARECIAKLCLVTRIDDDVRFESREEREKALLFLWDGQRLELHGVFRPDAAAKPLPESALPGAGAEGRSQLRVQPVYHFPFTLSEQEVGELFIVQKDYQGRATRYYKVQTHHPGWRYVLWDAAACEALLTQHYPWFLPTWSALGNSTVLKSDAIRPFILHAHGGVYLDLDSECFGSMQPWLAGPHLVLQAEPAVQDAHKAYAMYQYLYQELGFLGYFHGREVAAEHGGVEVQSLAGSGVVLKLGLARQRAVSLTARASQGLMYYTPGRRRPEIAGR